jgi:hypothetical protein
MTGKQPGPGEDSVLSAELRCGAPGFVAIALDVLLLFFRAGKYAQHASAGANGFAVPGNLSVGAGLAGLVFERLPRRLGADPIVGQGRAERDANLGYPRLKQHASCLLGGSRAAEDADHGL